MSSASVSLPARLSWMALLLSLGLLACKPSSPSITWEPEASTTLFLELKSLKGEPVPEARVRLPSGEWLQADASGQLLLKNPPRGRQFLQVEAPGFATTTMAVNVDEGVRAGSSLDLLPLGEPVATFNTSTGHTFAKGGVSVSVPPGELVDAEGRRLQGEVDAFLAPLDLEDLEKAELLAAPGPLLGELRPGEPPVILESVGLMVLTFKQKAGQGVSAQSEMSPGVSAQGVSAFARRLGVRGSAPGSVLANSAPPPGGRPDHVKARALSTGTLPQVPVWRLNPDSGIWVPTGDMATLVETSTSPRKLEWSVELTSSDPIVHLALPPGARTASASTIRSMLQQAPQEAWKGMGCLAVRVEDEEGQPVAGRRVVALGVDYVSVRHEVTDASGRALLEVVGNRTVRLDAGADFTRMPTGGNDGTCTGQGAEPTPVTLRVPSPTCKPGSERLCPGSKGATSRDGVGICRAPRQACDVNGSGWSATCAGEVLPQEERCDNALDDDCDGATNESCASVCKVGDTLPCYEGSEGTRDVGVCHGGTRTCVAGGTAWSDCKGQVLPEEVDDCSRPQDENCDGVACQCRPKDTRWCAYTGPAGTENKGQCHAGTQTCEDSGTGWSACTDEVTPQAERCDNAIDDDCNGLINDAPGCVCVPGTSEGCYTGPTGTEDVGPCHGGTRTCEASGTAWGPCTGESTPRVEEDCTTPGDDDCDGVVNEVSVCVCAPNSSKSCYSGPTGTQDVGVCRAGTETCNASGTAWGACTGDVTPQPESCASALDEDCDGQSNEAPPCGWVVTTGSPLVRANHSAVVLDNGKVLAAGGIGANSQVLASAEVYDPAAKTWTPVGSMTSARAYFIAVLLKNGRVLAVGGENNGAPLATTEEYDPTAGTVGTWTSVGSMATGRRLHTATLLNDGRVLVTGGFGPSGQAVATAELYDPAAKTWTPLNSMNSSRAQHAATLLNDGRVLVSGGKDASDTRLTTAEVYNPGTGTWTYVGSMNSLRYLHTSTRLLNGHVLVTGGFGAGASVLTAEVYNPLDESWTPAGTLSTKRDEHRAVLLNTGHVLITGGDDAIYSTDSTELYDPVARTWTITAPMTEARSAHEAVLLNTGEVLVLGGRGPRGAVGTTEVYNPTTQTIARAWMSTRSMATRRQAHTATPLSADKVLVTGGESAGTALASAEVFDLTRGTWSPTQNTLTTARTWHTATRLNDGKVLVVGGRDGSTSLKSAELYDPVANTWSTVNSLTWPREKHTATLLADGKVLVAGGLDGSTPVNTAEVYDPLTGDWTPTDNVLLTARYWHTATLLTNGKVLIAAGHGATGVLQQAEEYDPTNRTWSSAGPLRLSRDLHTATRLSNGKVLVAGGFGGGSFRQVAELYDPVARTWSDTGSLVTGRREHSTTLLGDGRVLVLGGTGNGNGVLPSSELYDPNTGVWAPANYVPVPVAQQTATMLGNGMVLVTGGHDSNGALNSALLYHP